MIPVRRRESRASVRRLRASVREKDFSSSRCVSLGLDGAARALRVAGRGESVRMEVTRPGVRRRGRACTVSQPAVLYVYDVKTSIEERGVEGRRRLET
jgi:hypothetical protein